MFNMIARNNTGINRGINRQCPQRESLSETLTEGPPFQNIRPEYAWVNDDRECGDLDLWMRT